MLYRATQDGQVMVETSDKMWSTGEGNGKPHQYSCHENPMNTMKRQKDRTLKDELPMLVQFSSVAQSCPILCDSMNPARQASLSITKSRSLFKLMSIELGMPSNHLILCRPLLLLPSIFTSTGSSQINQFFASGSQSIGISALTSLLPMNIQDLISFRMD